MNYKALLTVIGVPILLLLTTGYNMDNEPSKENYPPSLPSRGLCAHRGAMATHPENTIPAFLAAIEAGAHMIEFDVALTRDNQMVVLHDATVDRTTNGTGKVSDYSLAEIKMLDAGSWKSEEFVGTEIPTLEETLAIMPLNIWLNVHLKGGERLVEEVTKILVKENRLHQSLLACSADAARKAREISPDVIICNMDRRASNNAYAKETIDMNAGFIQFRGTELEEIYKCIPDLNRQGVKINYYGTDSIPLLKELFENGVHFPLVNDIINAMDKLSEKDFIKWPESE